MNICCSGLSRALHEVHGSKCVCVRASVSERASEQEGEESVYVLLGKTYLSLAYVHVRHAHTHGYMKATIWHHCDEEEDDDDGEGEGEEGGGEEEGGI